MDCSADVIIGVISEWSSFIGDNPAIAIMFFAIILFPSLSNLLREIATTGCSGLDMFWLSAVNKSEAPVKLRISKIVKVIFFVHIVIIAALELALLTLTFVAISIDIALLVSRGHITSPKALKYFQPLIAMAILLMWFFSAIYAIDQVKELSSSLLSIGVDSAESTVPISDGDSIGLIDMHPSAFDTVELTHTASNSVVLLALTDSYYVQPFTNSIFAHKLTEGVAAYSGSEAFRESGLDSCNNDSSCAETDLYYDSPGNNLSNENDSTRENYLFTFMILFVIFAGYLLYLRLVRPSKPKRITPQATRSEMVFAQLDIYSSSNGSAINDQYYETKTGSAVMIAA